MEKEKLLSTIIRECLETTKPVEHNKHFCSLYETEEHWAEVLRQFVKEGLESNEKVLYFGNQHSEEDVRQNLTPVIPTFDEYEKIGQYKYFSAEKVYSSEEFDWRVTIQKLKQHTEQAVSEGYARLRVTG